MDKWTELRNYIGVEIIKLESKRMLEIEKQVRMETEYFEGGYLKALWAILAKMENLEDLKEAEME